MLQTRKARDAVLVGAVVLLGLVSFGLGRLSVTSVAANGPMALCSTIPTEGNTLAASAVEAVSTVGSNLPETPVDKTAPSGEGKYTASKSGSVYHLPWCSGAKRIKEENRVWFDTREAAEAAGYRPATNCKGL